MDNVSQDDDHDLRSSTEPISVYHYQFNLLMSNCSFTAMANAIYTTDSLNKILQEIWSYSTMHYMPFLTNWTCHGNVQYHAVANETHSVPKAQMEYMWQ